MEEFYGCSVSQVPSPNIKMRSQTMGFEDCTGASRALEFVADGFYIYCRSTKQRSTLMQVSSAPASSNGNPLSAGQQSGALEGEVDLPAAVLDLACIDDQHVVASVGNTIDIWKRSATHGFVNMQSVRNCWKETSNIHLVVPRSEDSACLIAAVDGVHCIQLDGQCQKLRTFRESAMVTSLEWHTDARYIFSSTLDEGMMTCFDVRASAPISSTYLHKGLFDHKIIGNHHIVCSGLGGAINILDTRRLDSPVHTIADPFLQDIAELAVSASGDVMAVGKGGFTLWSTSRSSLSFRGLQETTPGMQRGSFASNKFAFTTDSNGGFQEWELRREAPLRERSVVVPPYKERSRDRAAASVKPAGGGREHGWGRDHGSTRSIAMVDELQPSEASASMESGTPSGDWDWDLDFQDGGTPKGGTGTEAAAANSNSSSSNTPQQADSLSSLPLKDLDELIGFYLS